MKNKSKFKQITIAIILIITLAMPMFLAFNQTKTNDKTYAQTINANQDETLLAEASNIVSLCNITQQGLVLNKNNFTQQVVPFTITNEGGTITSTEEKLVNVLYVVGSINITPIIEENGEPKKITVKKTIYDLNNFTPSTDFDQQQQNQEVIFGETGNIVQIGATIDRDVFTKITIIKPAEQPTNPNEQPTTLQTYDFYIFQAKNINYDNYGLNWYQFMSSATAGTDVDVSTLIIKPGENQTYTDYLQLKIDTMLFDINKDINKLYIDFWHNGKAYSLSIIKTENGDLKFYNNYIDKLNKNFLPSGQNENGEIVNVFTPVENVITLNFSESGEYKVRIYDNTYVDTKPTAYNDDCYNSTYPLANMQEYNFNVANLTKNNGFYCTATTITPKTDENGTIIDNKFNKTYIVADVDYTSTRPEISRQRVNGNVTVSFYNLSNVQEITNESYHVETGGNVIPQETIYNSSTSTNQDKLTFVLEDEASYNIRITFKNGSVKLFMFQILKGVHAVYDFEGTNYPLASDNIQYNIVTTYNLSQEYKTNEDYNCIVFEGMGIAGYVANNFKLNIAKSAPTITGISNNARSTSAVALTLTGVATQEVGMRVKVIKDGSVILNTTVYNADESKALTYALNYSNVGNYTIQLTDAMNNTTQLKFSITTQQNAAGIILIIIGCALGALAIIFIIRVRSKVSVR